MAMRNDQSFFRKKIAHANAPIPGKVVLRVANLYQRTIEPTSLSNLTSPKVLLRRHDPCHNDILHTGLDCDTRHQYKYIQHAVMLVVAFYYCYAGSVSARHRFLAHSCHQKLYLLVSPCRFLLIVDKSKGLFSRRHESCFKRP